LETVPNVLLNDGTSIPQLGFGVFKIDDDGAEVAVAHALEAGYRSIDTARIYDNEAGVGRAIRTSGIARDEIYVTTKVWNDEQGHDETLRAFDASMSRLDLDVLDLYLIHWPVPALDRYVETFRALLEIRDSGRLRSVGVSNFQPDHLDRLVAETGVAPVLNQVEVHPYLQQPELRAANAAKGVATEAWSPLGRGNGVLEDPVVLGLAARHGVTPAQVVIRWHLQLGTVVIPKSVTPSRIRENFDVFGFELNADDLAAIATLDRAARVGPDPDTFGG